MENSNVVKVDFNLTELQDYDFYHVKTIDEHMFFDLTFDVAKQLSQQMHFLKVIGTHEKIDLVLDYLNKRDSDIFTLDLLEKEDIFDSEDSIFTDCTIVFK